MQEQTDAHLALLLDLDIEPIVGDEVDVLDSVFPSNRDVAPISNEVNRLRYSEFRVLAEWMISFHHTSGTNAEWTHRDSEVKRKILDLTIVVFEEDQALIKLRIKRLKVIQIALLAKPLRLRNEAIRKSQKLKL